MILSWNIIYDIRLKQRAIYYRNIEINWNWLKTNPSIGLKKLNWKFLASFQSFSVNFNWTEINNFCAYNFEINYHTHCNLNIQFLNTWIKMVPFKIHFMIISIIQLMQMYRLYFWSNVNSSIVFCLKIWAEQFE